LKLIDDTTLLSRSTALSLRLPEWIAFGFFVYLGITALFTRAHVKRRHMALILVSVIGATFVLRATTLSVDSGIRDWLPAGDLLLAYWLPVLIAPAPDPGWERRFVVLDDRWLGQPLRRSQHWPWPVTALLEFSYLFCYPMVPFGFAVLFFGGFRADAERFWTAVLTAALPCYGLVVWLPMRPPRIVERSIPTSRSMIRALNLQVLRHASIQLNTFPSAHVAASVATALAVGARLPLIGAALWIITAGITVGSVLRRYHYAADAIAGIALGVAGFVLSRSV
jgi:hypothetical protein